MTTANKCRAKNPGSCRVHGTVNAVDVITNDKIAQRNLFESKGNLDKADSMESFFESTEQVAHDQKAYDATIKGTKALQDDLDYHSSTLTSDQVLDIKRRLIQASEYRQEVLSTDPAHRETEENYERFTEEHAVSKHSFSKENLHESLNELKDLPNKTPIAVKFKNGAVLYGHSGIGMDKEPTNRFSRMMAKSGGSLAFVQGHSSDIDKYKHVSFNGFYAMVRVKEIKEINVLKPDAYDKGFDAVLNSHATKDVYKGEAPHRESSRWAVQGDNYYFEIEGTNSTNTSNVSEEARSRSWTSGRLSLWPRERSNNIREIKSPK